MKLLERSKSQRGNKEQKTRGRKEDAPIEQNMPVKEKRSVSKRKSIFQFGPQVPAAPVSAAPVSAAPVSAAPVSAVPVSTAPISTAPVYVSQMSASPVSAPPAQASTFNKRPKSSSSRMSFSRPRTAETPEPFEDLPLPFETIDFRAGKDTYSFPTPSPRMSVKAGTFPASSSPSSSTRQPSPRIGVALGSPPHKPPCGRAYTSDQASSRMSRPPLQAAAQSWQQPSAEPEKPQLKKSKSAWKTFGGFFKSKQTREPIPEPFYRVQPRSSDRDVSSPRAVNGRVGVLESATPSPVPLENSKLARPPHDRVPSHNRGMSRFEARAEVERASVMKNVESQTRPLPSKNPARASTMPQAKPSKAPTADVNKSEDIFKAFEAGSKDGAKAPVAAASPRTPRLDVNLPGTEFERYSVMFEKLLEPKVSLLERRQSKLTRLSSTKKTDVARDMALPCQTKTPTPGVPKRSLTSPHLNSPNLTRVPSLSIKVATKRDEHPARPHAQGPVFHRPRPLARARTAPPAAVSPVTARFNNDDSKNTINTSATPRTASPASPCSPPYSENSLPPTPTSTFTAGDIEPIAVMSHEAPLLPRLVHAQTEPTWDMVTSKSPVQPPARSPLRDQNTRIATARTPDGRHLRIKDAERHIVQVSVARQVSVSKARRRVQNAVEVKQPLRPRVVELGKNRKSTVVLIESDDS